MLDLLRGAGNVDLLEVDYVKLLESPNESLPRIAEFAKIDSAQLDLMASAIDPGLRHFGPLSQRL